MTVRINKPAINLRETLSELDREEGLRGLQILAAEDAAEAVEALDLENHTFDINGGTIDGVTIGGASAGAATFTDVTASGTINLSGATVSNGGSVTTVDINGGTIDGTTIGGASAGAATFTDVTASGTINLSGATVSNGGSVTTVDINGGTIDGTTIGGASAAAGTFTNVTATGTINLSGATVSNGGSVTTVDINGGTIDGTVIGGITPDVGVFTELSATIPDPSLLPIGTEVLWPSSNISNLPTDWSDTKLRLLTGASERAIISNIAIGYRANGFTPGLVFDFVDELYITDNAIDAFSDAITHTRASTATYVDSSGVLQTAASGEPRIGHHVWDGSAWVNEGLLHESEARTNLVTYSEDFTNAAWSKSGATVAGTTFTSTATSVNIFMSVSGAGLTNAYTVEAKAGTAAFCSIRSFSSTGATGETYFDLSSGTVSSLAAGHTAFITPMGGGWFRCSVVATTASAPAFFAFRFSDASGNSTVTIGATVDFRNLQLEAAPTPSSYIPTSGSTVTRAADVLTIPSANLPWPTPNVIGPELVTNGTFDTDLTGWTVGIGSPTVVSGQVEATTTGSGFIISQTFNVTPGATYVFSGERGNTNGTFWGYNSTFIGVAQAFDGRDGSPMSFTATSTVFTVGYYSSFSGTRPHTVDNISVREINPLAVSIQMDGAINYSDEGIAAQQMFLRWQLDANNYISVDLDTDSTATGEVNFNQAASGTVDTVATAGNALSPSIATAFNIASRHGSTFINGALGGTALTADTTPVALPDLSATDLNLGFDYMGIIRTFRVWANDIGDTGIEEAST